MLWRGERKKGAVATRGDKPLLRRAGRKTSSFYWKKTAVQKEREAKRPACPSGDHNGQGRKDWGKETISRSCLGEKTTTYLLERKRGKTTYFSSLGRNCSPGFLPNLE